MMDLAFVCMILLSLLHIVLSMNIQIQALPQHVNYTENDLVILCSITNPSQISSVYYIKLEQNSSTGFETSVSIFKDQNPPISWPSGSALQNGASATGSIDTPSSAQLKLTIDKNIVQCPTDFTAYKCKLSGFSSATSDVVTQETNPITVTFSVQPRMIQTPTIKVLVEPFDTSQRIFPVATALQLTCEGQVGNDESKSSTITYKLTSTDTFTQFLCESGDEGLCGTGSAIQYVNISIEEYFSDEASSETGTETGAVIGSVVGTFALLTTVIFLVYFARKHYKCTCEKRSEKDISNNPQKSSDIEEEKLENVTGNVTVLGDTDRNPEVYDEITTAEDRDQYEVIPENEYQGPYTHPYDRLKKDDNRQLSDDKEDASQTAGKSETANKALQKMPEEYENMSFTR